MPATGRVITVRVEDGEPVRGDDGQLLVATIQSRSASSQWLPYAWNDSTGDYRFVDRDRDSVPDWYKRPAHTH